MSLGLTPLLGCKIAKLEIGLVLDSYLSMVGTTNSIAQVRVFFFFFFPFNLKS